MSEQSVPPPSMEECHVSIPVTILMANQHDIVTASPVSFLPCPFFYRNMSPSARRRRGNYPFKSLRKKAISLVRLRLVAVPNDNSKGKSSRFKSSRLSLRSHTVRRVIAREQPSHLSSQVSCRSTCHTIECVLTPPTSRSYWLHPSCLYSHAIARDLPRLLLPLRLSINTMTPPVSTSNQIPCFLPEDPPHRMKSPPPPSTVSTLVRLNQTSPLITFSTLLPPQRYFPPLNQLLPSSIDSTRPPLNVSTLPPSFQMAKHFFP